MRGYASLVRALRKTNAVLIVAHQNADPDATCSAYAFSVLVHRINRKARTTITSPEGVSKLSKQIIASGLPIVIDENPDLPKFQLIVTVDTNTLQQLGHFREPVQNSGKPLVMIDHHAPHPENAKFAKLVLSNQHSTSTCEMILEMYTKLRLKPDRNVSHALFIGIMVETGHMSIANRKTFAAAHRLVETGANPETALALTRSVMDESERIARIKSAQRLRMEKIDKWLIAMSEVGSYHASAARALIGLGAHLAIVAGRRNDDLTVSFRCTRDFLDATKIHLGSDLATVVGQRMGGMGGGHATAAGANVRGEARDALKLSLQLVRELFSKKSSKPNTQTESNAQTAQT